MDKKPCNNNYVSLTMFFVQCFLLDCLSELQWRELICAWCYEKCLIGFLLGLQVGMQNSSLGVVLATAHFSSPLVALPPALSAVVMNMMGSTLGLIWQSISPSVSENKTTDITNAWSTLTVVCLISSAYLLLKYAQRWNPDRIPFEYFWSFWGTGGHWWFWNVGFVSLGTILLS